MKSDPLPDARPPSRRDSESDDICGGNCGGSPAEALASWPVEFISWPDYAENRQAGKLPNQRRFPAGLNRKKESSTGVLLLQCHFPV
jgi:hypothetical protein